VPRGPDETQWRGDVRVEDLGDGAEVGVHQRPVGRVDRGVVDHRIAPPEFVEHRLHGRLRDVRITDRTLDRHDPGAERGDRSGGLFQLGRLTRDDADVAAGRGTRLGDGPADSPGSAGDQDGPAVDP